MSCLVWPHVLNINKNTSSSHSTVFWNFLYFLFFFLFFLPKNERVTYLLNIEVVIAMTTDVLATVSLFRCVELIFRVCLVCQTGQICWRVTDVWRCSPYSQDKSETDTITVNPESSHYAAFVWATTFPFVKKYKYCPCSHQLRRAGLMLASQADRWWCLMVVFWDVCFCLSVLSVLPDCRANFSINTDQC